MVICLERGADLHMAQPMPLLLAVSCFSKIQIGLPFWYRLTRVVPEKGPLNGCVYACVVKKQYSNGVLLALPACTMRKRVYASVVRPSVHPIRPPLQQSFLLWPGWPTGDITHRCTSRSSPPQSSYHIRNL